LWNAGTTRKVRVIEIGYHGTAGIATGPQSLSIRRISTQGTATTVTPDIDNAWDHDVDDPSAVVINHTYTAQPTLASPAVGPAFAIADQSGSIANGFIWSNPDGIEVGPGAGLAIVQTQNQASGQTRIGECYFVWEDGSDGGT
jgi:hypothetical protein